MKLARIKFLLLCIFIIPLLNLSCTYESSSQYVYQEPDQINDGIKTGTLAEVGIDSTIMIHALDKIISGKYGEIHSMLVYKANKLVFEEYFAGHMYQWDKPHHHGHWTQWEKSKMHDLKSVTKSITGICVGIAVEKGFIENLDQSIFDYLPEYRYLQKDGHEDITLEHLLTMTSGLEWDEWGAPLSSAENDIIGLWFHCDDQIKCILERPLEYDPGSEFTYNGGNMILLGEIIKNASNMMIDKFSRTYLFEPLGIDTSSWEVRYPDGTIEAGGGLYLTPRAMLKIGITCLNDGIWHNKQVIPEDWVRKCNTVYNNNRRINIPGVNSGRNGYGYSWWINRSGKFDFYYASGWGGQHIIVIPEQDMVVVFTGGNYTSKVKVFSILRNYLFTALLE